MLELGSICELIKMFLILLQICSTMIFIRPVLSRHIEPCRTSHNIQRLLSAQIVINESIKYKFC